MPPKKPKINWPGFSKPKFTGIGGTWAELKFNSKNPVVPVVVAGHGKPKKMTPTGLDFDSNQIRSSVFAIFDGLQTTHHVRIPNLTPDEEFFTVIKGKDHLNRVDKFKTHRRRLDIRFFQIKVLDDSDDLSPGELKFGFFINGDNAPNGTPLIFPLIGAKALSTGQQRAISVKATVFGGDLVTVKVTGVDNDDDPDLWVDQLGPKGQGLWPPTLPTLGSGSNSFYEWASRQEHVGVDFPGKDEEDRTVPFVLDAKWPQKVDLHFQVKGEVKVSHP